MEPTLQDLIARMTEIDEAEDKSCPLPTQDLELNHIQYGPLNIDYPGDFWEEIAEFWDTTEEAAENSLCGNCSAFDISPRMLECMPGETSDDDGVLGYCWMHKFKCHSARTCRTWAKGGPIETDEKSLTWDKED